MVFLRRLWPLSGHSKKTIYVKSRQRKGWHTLGIMLIFVMDSTGRIFRVSFSEVNTYPPKLKEEWQRICSQEHSPKLNISKCKLRRWEGGLGISSVVKSFPSMCETLGWFPAPSHQNKQTKKWEGGILTPSTLFQFIHEKRKWLPIYSVAGQKACTEYNFRGAILACSELEVGELSLHLLELTTK
jgi:hypothetical protein